ncbi:hypothetical protein BGW39_000909 [Mortierella sp. 14UC]|nr:hypothetical protein BGW39_000909 [Mortierella sp. 14UC]
MARLSDLPVEIIALIADHFTTRDTFKTLTLVSRFCEQQFGHYLWQHVKVDNLHSGRQLLPVLNKHAHSIFSLCLNGQVHKDYYNTFPRLVTFQQHYTEHDDANPEVVSSTLSGFLQRHPTIQNITITARPGLRLSEEFWDTVFYSLSNPTQLKIDGIQDMATDGGTGGSAFQRACSRFEEIGYSGIDQSGLELQNMDFSRLQRLAYSTLNMSDGPSGVWEWMGRCRNLTRLHWKGLMTVSELAIATELQVWPFLEDFSLGDVSGSDEELAALIGYLPPLKHLRLSSWKFGPTCYNVLRDRHLASLRTLSIPGSNWHSSRINMSVLQHFVHLEEFEASFTCLRDLLVGPRPWVCQGLRRLRVNFESDPDRQGLTNLLFHWLSKMTQLEELDISRYPRAVCTHRSRYYGQWPQFTLGVRYFERLATLKQLKIFRFHGVAQRLKACDVEWMLKHWPMLEELGPCHFPDPETLERVNALLRQRGLPLCTAGTE